MLLALALWFAYRSQHGAIPNETAILDLRGYSVERGQEAQSHEPPLDIHRRTRYLVLYLPIGSEEGSYEVGVLNASGQELMHKRGTAKLENHIVVLRADIDIADVPSGSYFLGVRKQGFEWTRFPVRIF